MIEFGIAFGILCIYMVLEHWFRDESGWWMLPFGLVFCKSFQAQLINCHVANLEIQDPTLYSNDPNVFWQS